MGFYNFEARFSSKHFVRIIYRSLTDDVPSQFRTKVPVVLCIKDKTDVAAEMSKSCHRRDVDLSRHDNEYLTREENEEKAKREQELEEKEKEKERGRENGRPTEIERQENEKKIEENEKKTRREREESLSFRNNYYESHEIPKNLTCNNNSRAFQNYPISNLNNPAALLYRTRLESRQHHSLRENRHVALPNSTYKDFVCLHR